ncbi:MAG: family 1 glycosylhydrolase, partial [bacterium]
MFKFPENFLWGAATSSYQVEGGIENNDWAKKFPAGRACDHYNLYEKDFNLAKFLNHNAHRLSVEWARIEPEEGRFDEKEIEHY